MIRSFLACASAALSLVAAPALSREIVVTNDDGLTSNVVALYKALKAAGHDVIVSVPCTNQSGMSAAIRFARPLGPLAADCLNDAAKAGAPGAGAMTRAELGPDFFYVDGTPAMALLYGLDILAPKRWRHGPDLVLSGPNEGQNLGAMVIASGTVGAAQTAALRGVPAIALSAGIGTVGDKSAPLANPASVAVAEGAVRLVQALAAGTGADAPLLPAGVVLNVNFPDLLADAGWRLTRIGDWGAYSIRFSESLPREATPATGTMVQAGTAAMPGTFGMTFAPNRTRPSSAQQNDEGVVNARSITVSPMQAGYGMPAGADWLASRLRGLLGGKAR